MIRLLFRFLDRISLVFLNNLRHKKVILKLTDLQHFDISHQLWQFQEIVKDNYVNFFNIRRCQQNLLPSPWGKISDRAYFEFFDSQILQNGNLLLGITIDNCSGAAHKVVITLCESPEIWTGQNRSPIFWYVVLIIY